MTIQTLKEPLPNFPPAKLFLDDLDEIVAIFREVVETAEPQGTTDQLKTNFTFTCAGRRCTTLEEVPKILKPRREFHLRIARGKWEMSLYCNPWTHSMWFPLIPHGEAEVSSAHRRLKPIFERRKRHLSAALHSAPFWAWLFISSVVPLLVHFLRLSLYQRIGPKPADPFADLLLAAYVLLLLASMLTYTTLSPRNSYDLSPTRKLLTEKALPIILAAAVGVLGTLLTQFLIHKIWPTH
jgi:hypothetical protein